VVTRGCRYPLLGGCCHRPGGLDGAMNSPCRRRGGCAGPPTLEWSRQAARCCLNRSTLARSLQDLSWLGHACGTAWRSFDLIPSPVPLVSCFWAIAPLC
jgi:hypothetical protein